MKVETEIKDYIKEYGLTLEIKVGPETGVFMGKIKEFKGISAYDESMEELYIRMNISLDAYFDAFPYELEKLQK